MRTLVITVVVVMAAGGGGTTIVQAQPGGHGAGHGAEAGAEPHRAMQRWLEESDRVMADGRGAGLAFAADQHGYPGPLHVLELKDRLRLTPAQETRTRQLLEAMFAASRPAAARLAEAERRLRELFAGGGAHDGAVRAAVAEAERARAEVRLVHLLAHVKTRDVLTADQRRLYHEARWGHGMTSP